MSHSFNDLKAFFKLTLHLLNVFVIIQEYIVVLPYVQCITHMIKANQCVLELDWA